VTRRLDRPGVEIRMPTDLEWEYAARGLNGQVHSWGNDGVQVIQPFTGGLFRPRSGIGSAALAVSDTQLARDDASPFGAVAMCTNVGEYTLLPGRLYGDVEREDMTEFPSGTDLREAIEQQVVKVYWRCASVSNSLASVEGVKAAQRAAQAWQKAYSEPRESRHDRGIRLVKVKTTK
jgi:formylglycine-generating enzyme required for sulfatase activity